MRRRSAVPITEISEADTEMTTDLTVTNAAAIAKDIPTMMSVSAIRPSVMSARSALSVTMNAMTTAVLSSEEIPLSRH